METIAKHAKRLGQRYSRSANSREVITSAKQLAQIVLRSSALLPRHKKKSLSEVQWLISLVDGKYTTRYRSKKVVDLARSYPKSSRKIQHEHVNTRKELTELILAKPKTLSALLDRVTACVVTQKEHKRLNNSARGWARYKEAGVLVYDMSTDPPKLKNLQNDGRGK
jgi:hypothetical protein